MSDFNHQGQLRHAAVQRVAGMNLDGASDRAGGTSQRGGSNQGSQRGGSQQGSQRGSVGGTQAGGSTRGSAAGSPPRGPGSQAGGSVRGSPPQDAARSRAGSAAGNTSGSQPRGQAGPTQFGKGLGYDPAIDPKDPKSSRPMQLSDTELVGKRVDLPADAFKSVSIN
jgi:hypothetical protein